jgi:hypothetical protein
MGTLFSVDLTTAKAMAKAELPTVNERLTFPTAREGLGHLRPPKLERAARRSGCQCNLHNAAMSYQLRIMRLSAVMLPTTAI